MTRPATTDFYTDILTIARIEAALNVADRRKAPEVRDFTRLARYVPGLRA